MKKEKLFLFSKDIARVAIMSAILIVGKFALQFVANIEVVTTLVVAFSFVFGIKTVFATLIFCTIDMILYPVSIDVVVSYYLYWNLLSLVTVFIKNLKIEAFYVYLIVALIMTLLFGIITSAFYSLFFSAKFFAVYSAGLLFFAFHILSTLVFMIVGFRPLVKLLNKFNT